MATTSLQISVTTNDIIAKIRRNLAIIGKRAKNTDGDSLYTDITASAAEETIFNDLLMFGAETIVSELSDVATTYIDTTTNLKFPHSVTTKVVDAEGNTTSTTDTSYNEDVVTNGISFIIVSTRWNVSTTEEEKTVTDGSTVTTIKVTEPDLINALKGLISNYLYNFCLACYLSEIHPSTGEKYPPLWGQTYTDHCALLIKNIKTLAFLKRPKEASQKDGKDIGYGNLVVDTKEINTKTT